MKSKDPLYNRDRDQWSIFRVKSASFLLKKVDGFIKYVELRQHRAVVCFYFHPWEFYEMPRSINCIEATVRPALISVKNCGKKGVKEFDKLCVGLSMRGARFVTTKEIANEY